uniref:Dol-P-Glc:Glc(2)Man(9)GlcNAc(2)-PP-Dol alpha-1,2-glucosyltransferase n=1 Tax=Syphacia muris TaxID=451379 RepID=A0A0N5AP62_9BILA
MVVCFFSVVLTIYLLGIIGAILGFIHGVLVWYTYKKVPKPYMDEIFHVNQARRFCALDFSWNEKITTPPALYLLSMLGFCGIERYTNSVLIPFFYVGAVRFRKLFTNEQLEQTALIVLLLPMLFHSSLLYYTDLLSITTLLWGFSCKTPTLASVFFFVAVLTRQTNIVWAGVYGVAYLVKLIDFRNIVRSLCYGLIRLWSLIGLAFIFVLFFILNGYRIALGDHSAHEPRFHFMQVYYCFSLLCIISAPLFLQKKVLLKVFNEFITKPIRNSLYCIIILLCIHFFTFEHPYLLADNRHFTFYIWRKWFKRHWLCRYLVAPFYLLSLYMFKQSIHHINRFLLLLFLTASIVALAPLPLFETRYYIVPFVLWRLCVKSQSQLRCFIEILYISMINAVVLYLFYEKPFTWKSAPEKLQRFMW